MGVSTILEVSNLSKRFGGTKAVDKLSFRIQKGEVLGLLGPNGSGKTTTLGMILGVTRPTSGEFSWFEKGAGSHLRQHIGSLLERPRFYPWMSGKESLKLTACLRGASFSEIPKVLDRVGLADVGRKKVGEYSLGMKQRLGIAACLLGDPKVMVLDEPTNGMDPQGIADIRDLILQEKEKGTTVILASHILDEVEKVCSHVLMLNRGQVLSQGALQEVLGGDSWYELSASSMSALIEALKKHPYLVDLSEAEEGRVKASFSSPLGGDELNRYLFDQQVCLSHLEERRTSLEENFLNKLKDSKGGGQ